MRFNYAETRAVIRIRSLDRKGLVSETYELLRSGDRDMLGREGIEFSKEVNMGRCSQGQVKGFGGDSKRRMTRARRKACNF
jgi:hypothetical protein